jgi:3-hydroxyisobutyrate dehydrogenase-like beta-hydroxyacid dehydrogenase
MSGSGRTVTVGLLYPGELGTALAALLAGRGVRVVTTLAGRSDRTAERARRAVIEVLPNLRELVRQADVVISLVPPAAAEQTAAEWSELAAAAPRGAIYVDANSIGPEQAAAIGQRVTATGKEFVDAAINGLAKNLSTGGTLFLSGSRASELAALVGDAMRVQVVGDEPGRASAMKMLLSGLSKGLCALFTETALVADRQGLLPDMIEAYRRIYPGVMTVVDRMLPTYDRHAARRATETREVEETARAAGVEPLVLTAVRELHEQIARVTFDRPAADPWTVSAIVERLNAAGTLSPNEVSDAERAS